MEGSESVEVGCHGGEVGCMCRCQRVVGLGWKSWFVWEAVDGSSLVVEAEKRLGGGGGVETINWRARVSMAAASA